MASTSVKNDILVAGFLAVLGCIVALMGRMQLPPPQDSLQQSSRGDVLTVLERERRGEERGRIEFHMKNGEVWTYAHYLPHYRVVAALGAGPLDQVELKADGKLGRDFLRNFAIRHVFEIRVGDQMVASYEDVSSAASRNAKGVTYLGGAMTFIGFALIGWEVRKSTRRMPKT